MEKNNKLIAEFMELPLVPCNIGTENGAVTEGYQHPKVDVPCTAYGLQYHSSWDWLMPVVKKISRKIDKPLDEVVSLLTEVGSDNIWGVKSLHNAVVEFIKEYNEKN